MAIIRSKIARQLLAEGGVSLDDAKMMAPPGEFLAYINPKEADMLKAAGGSGIMTPMGIPSFIEYDDDFGSGFQSAKSTPSSTSDSRDTYGENFQGQAFGSNKGQMGPDPTGNFDNLNFDNVTGRDFRRISIRPDGRLDTDDFVNKIQDARSQSIINFLNRSAAPTLRRQLGLGKTGDINYVLEQLQSNKGDPFAIGLTPKQFEIGQKLIDAGIRNESDIRAMTQTKFDELFPGPKTDEGGDNEPIRRLRAPITEKKEEPKKREFDDILKFYGARFAKGGTAGDSYGEDIGAAYGTQGLSERENTGGDNGDDPPMIQPDTSPRGTGPLGMPTFQNLQTHFANNAKLEEAVRMGLITNEEYNVLGGYDARQTLGLGPVDTFITSGLYNVAQSLGKGRGNQPFSEIPGDVMRNVKGASTKGISPELQGKYEAIVGPRAGMMTSLEPYGGPRRFQADGGEVRQEYGLGSIVKKATRAVKKVAKSPLGKAALIAGIGAYGLGAGPFANVAGSGFLKGPLAKKLFLKKGATEFALSNLNPFSAITAASLLAGALSKEDEEDEKLPTVANTDPAIARTLEFYGGPRRFAAEGGMMEQDEMLDLGGNEMDLRGGGFVPLGEYEKKDDVPARLSKNEFVFTADAVRAAGGGSVDKGADVMYKTMKTLENKVA